jgi:hypothetical protein
LISCLRTVESVLMYLLVMRKSMCQWTGTVEEMCFYFLVPYSDQRCSTDNIRQKVKSIKRNALSLYVRFILIQAML